MKFIIEDIEHSFLDIERLIGYKPVSLEYGDKFGFIRKLSQNDYPRFHLLISDKYNRRR